jgi:hypothetical protein
LVIGFSSYPLISSNGVTEEVARILRPGGKVIAFQDSLVFTDGKKETVYDKQKNVEILHQLLTQKFPENGIAVADGDDPLESVVLTPYHDFLQRLQPDIRGQIPQDKFVLASINDLGLFRVYSSYAETSQEKVKTLREDLGNPRSLQNIDIHPSLEVLEYIRIRYIVGEKN